MPRLSYDLHLIPLCKMPSAIKLLQEHGFITNSMKWLDYRDLKSNEVRFRDHAGFLTLSYFK